MAHLLGAAGRRRPDAAAQGPSDAVRRVGSKNRTIEEPRHTKNCAVSNGNLAVCTCGALFRYALSKANGGAAP